MRQMARKTVLLVVLTAFAVGWVFLMNLGAASPSAVQRRPAAGPDGSTASITLIDADSAFPTINTHVLIRDKNGQPARGLNRKDFELTEDGVQVDITEFLGAGQQDVTALLVVDHSGSMEGSKVAGAREAAKVFVSMTREDQDSLGILIFDDEINTLSPLKRVNGSDKDVLAQRINGISAEGGTAFHDAVYVAVEQLQDAAGRKVVIALTDGMDEDSRRSVDQVIRFAKDNHIPVYTIGLGSGREIDTDRLQKLARETSGEFHQTPTADQLAELYRRIAEELQNEYVLSFTSPTPNLDGTRRDVVVNVAYGGGTLSASRPYTVGGIIKSSFNYPFFGALLLLLLVLIVLPGVARRVYANRPSPEPVAPPAISTGPVADGPEPPQPEPTTPASTPRIASPPSPTPEPATPPSPVAPTPPRLVARLAIPRESVSLGSSEGGDIVIPVPSVVAQHARVDLENGRYVIADLSQGHTAVSFGGDPAQLRPTQRNALKDASLVKLGEVVLTFRQPAQGSPWLEMACELNKAVVSVGSDASNDIVLSHPSISPRHADLRQEAGRWVVYDLGGAHGTFVSYSGEPAQERQVQTNALKSGSTVRFGRLIFTFRQ